VTSWVTDAQGLHVLRGHGAAVSFDAFLDGLASDPVIRAALTDLLRSSPYAAFCWETPALTPQSGAQPFRCAIVESPALATVTADPTPFRAHLRAGGEVVDFDSLGGDSRLVAPVPRPGVDLSVYAHLASFVRGAPPDQVDALWVRVAEVVAELRGRRPRWLSTAGLGVSWLHVRLDPRPKYYRTATLR
jgi:hypothetical protein